MLAQSQTEGFDELAALTLSDWLWAGGLVLGSIIIAVVASRLIYRSTHERLTPIVARLVARVVASVIFIMGVVYALAQVGVSIAPLLGLVGLFGLALAFAFQEVLENFIAGIFLSVRRPFNVNDEITTADHEGRVEDIKLRALTLTTYSGERVYIPNATVWGSPIINHTELGNRRTTLAVGVGYDTDLERAEQVLLEAMGTVDGVLDEPAPQAYAHEFGDSSINYALRFWHQASISEEWKVRNSVAKSVKSALDDAGIEIPFPQRVIAHLNQSPDQSS